MASSPSHRDARRARLQQLASAQGVGVLPPLPPLTTEKSASFRTPNDDQLAEELLKRRKLSANPDRSSQGGIKRAFTTSKKSWDSKEIFGALEAHVSNHGSPGVADALIAKLYSVGGNLNVPNTKNRMSLLGRKKSLESMERSRILQKAIENRQTDMIAVLAQHADSLTLDAALPFAIRSNDFQILQLLLAHGASVVHTQDGQDAFRQICIVGRHADLVGLVLQSDGKPPPAWVSLAMVDAVRVGDLETVLRLSRSTADGNHNNAEALKTAISLCRADISMAILTGAKPPTPGSQGLMECFTQLFQQSTVGPNEKILLAEALLCAGAAGDAVSAALTQACMTEFYDMIDLLVSYGASVEFQDANVIRHTVSRGQSGLVQMLLGDKSVLSPLYASECVAHLPKTVGPEDRHAILNILLRKGAGGVSLSDALIDAVRAIDIQSIELLLTPHFPGGKLVSSPDLHGGPRGMVYERHETASVDHKEGAALGIAVMMGSAPMVKLLLTGKPSPETLGHIFPRAHSLPPVERYHITEGFLAAGLPAPSISAALEKSIEEKPPHRDENLIGLLLRHNANVNFNGGGAVLSAIKHKDLRLLATLLSSKPTTYTLAAGMEMAMKVEDKRARFEIVRLLIDSGAGREGTEVSAALIQLLSIKPVDMQLASLLLERGRADANFDDGGPFNLAVLDPNDALLELVLHHGKPSNNTLYRGLYTLAELPTNPAKVAKFDAILRRTKKEQTTMDTLLFNEVQTALTCKGADYVAVIRLLLSAGASVNTPTAGTLSSAVRAVDAVITDLLLSAEPKPEFESLRTALHRSVNIGDSENRLSFTQKLIKAGLPNTETNLALIYTIKTHAEDRPLIGLLAAHADSSSGEALFLAITCEHSDVVDLVLAKTPRRYAAFILQEAFKAATKVGNKEKRVAICKTLLKKGVSGHIVSDALVTASSDRDLALAAVLMDHGAAAEHREGQAILEACAAGASDVLEVLLTSKVVISRQLLEKGFQAATQVGNLNKRAAVFRLLLESGITGEAVDAQLVSAAKFGDDGEGLVRLLLQYGASVDYSAGDAIWNATRSAIMGSLKLMLGVEKVGERQAMPSRSTLLRALKASRKLSRDPRYQVIDWLFQAGLPACEEIHIALHRAIKDEPDIRLVRLLLKNGASPLANGCETLIDAVQFLLTDVLAVLLEAEIPQKDISWAFQQAFTPETTLSWLSDQGFQVAEMLLAKGADGESLSVALSMAIDFYGSDRDGIARQFAGLLLQFNADVSYKDGLVMQKATQKADSELIQLVLAQKPDSRAVSMAFPYIFASDLSEEETLVLMTLFTEYHNGEERLDPLFSHPTSEPVIFRALAQFPRSAKILQTLLDDGYYHDQLTMLQVTEDVDEDEQVSLLFWALYQPQKRISSTVIELLINRGANVNFETRLSKITPIMLAIKQRRPDLVKALILAGAEVDVIDATGNTPMTMATAIGSELGTSMMANILIAEPSKNDGSLHNVARQLNLRAVEMLIDYGHEVDFPSPLHSGRTTLGELCLNAAHAGPLSAAQEKQMEKVMTLLVNSGTDLTIQSDGKSVLLLALTSADPLPTTRALLKVGMWRHVNQPYNHYKDGTYTYSASQFAARLLPKSDTRSQLLELLKANRVVDVYYAEDGPQPKGAVNLPEELLRADRERRAWNERIAKEQEEHKIALARTKEMAQTQNQILLSRAELEDARDRRKHDNEMKAIQDRQAAEDRAYSAEYHRRNVEREATLRHERQLLEAGLSRTRLIAEAELELTEKKQQKMIAWDESMSKQRLASEIQMSQVRVRERQEISKLEEKSEARTTKRIQEHKRLVDSQNHLATQLGHAGVDQRRQIGYITGS